MDTCVFIPEIEIQNGTVRCGMSFAEVVASWLCTLSLALKIPENTETCPLWRDWCKNKIISVFITELDLKQAAFESFAFDPLGFLAEKIPSPRLLPSVSSWSPLQNAQPYWPNTIWKIIQALPYPRERIFISSLQRGIAKPSGTPDHKMVPTPWGDSGHVGAGGFGAAIPGGASGSLWSLPAGSRQEELGGSPRGGVGRQQRPGSCERGATERWGDGAARSCHPSRPAAGSGGMAGKGRDLSCPSWGDAAPGGALNLQWLPWKGLGAFSSSARFSGPSGLDSGIKGSTFLPRVSPGSTHGAAVSGRGVCWRCWVSHLCCWSCLLACGEVASAPEDESRRKMQIN